MSYHRRPLDLIVSGTDPMLIAAILHDLGASTIPLPAESVMDAIRRSGSGAIAANAIVIDGLGYGGDDGAAVRRAMALAADVRGQPDHVFQPTGTRWKNTPIFIVVRDDGLAFAVSQERVGAIGLSPMKEWHAIYGVVDSIALQYEYAVLEDMLRLGVRTSDVSGRVIRMGPPMLRRHHGAPPEIETELYSLAADIGLRRGRSPWTARHVALLSREAVDCDFREAEEILSAKHGEGKVQNLFQRGAYFLGATSHELFSHPRIVASITNIEYIPDIVVHRAATGALELNELKTRHLKVISKGRYPAPTGHLMRGVSQIVTYRAQVSAPEQQDRIRAIFGATPSAVSTRLIAGDTRDVASELLNHVRSLVGGSVEYVGVNEVIERAVARLT